MARSQSDSSEKKFPPTRRRKKKAREQGDVARSRDLTAAAVLMAWLVAGTLGGGMFIRTWESHASAAVASVRAATPQVLCRTLWDYSPFLAVSVLGILLPVAIVGCLAQFAQVGPIFALQKVSLDFSHLNPAEWAKRLLKWEKAVELLKAVGMQAIALCIGLGVAKACLPLILSLPNGTPQAALAVLGHALQRLFALGAVFALGLGLADLLYQRFIFLRNMRMSLADFRRDRKEMDGNPQIRSRRKKMYRELVNHNAVEAVRGAAVVVTNPTHYAVALSYDPSLHAAPVLAAKGQDELAAEIRRAAEDTGVPIIRNPPLARELHERLDIEDSVPEDLFVAVAEVIIWARGLAALNHN